MFFTCSDATVYYNANFGESSGPYHLDGLGCDGYEANLTACPRQYTSGGGYNNGIGVHDCAPGNEAGVKCDGTWLYQEQTADYICLLHFESLVYFMYSETCLTGHPQY